MSKLPPGGVPLTGLAAGAPEQPAKPELSNYEVLEANRLATLEFADSIAATALVQPAVERGVSLEELVKGGEWSKAIIMLDEMKDNKLGIVWHESEDLGQGTRAIVRDARKVKTDPAKLKQEAGEKYAMQILNEVRGSLDLVDKSDAEPEQKQAARARLEFIAQNAVADIDSLNSKTVKTFNTQIVHSLETAGIEGAAKKLVFAKEIGNLRDEHRHIVTLTKAKDKDGAIHTVTEADIMLGGLTDEQKKQYDTVSKSTKGASCGIEWFDRMDPYKKDLVRDIAVDIASGKKVIPTQFLSDLPGIKNAYQKVTAIRGQREQESKVIEEGLHCGTPGSRIRVVGNKERQEITKQNVEQLQSFAASEAKVNLNILYGRTVVPIPGMSENDIYDQVHDGDFGANVFKTASSINRSRHVPGGVRNRAGGGRDTKTYETVLHNIAQGLIKSDTPKGILSKEAAEYFKKGGKVAKAKLEAEIKEQENPKLVSMLNTMVRCRELADSSTLTTDSKNINLEMTSKINVIISSARLENGALKQLLAPEVITKIPVSVDFCKSGKDRTGMVKTKTTQDAVNTYLDIDPKSDVAKENLLAQVAGGHTQEMAGVQGGTVGCHAIKLSAATTLTKEDEPIIGGIINQASAGFNSKIKVKKGKEAKAITTAFETDFAARPMAPTEIDLDAPEQARGVVGSKPEDRSNNPSRSEDTKEYVRVYQVALDKFKKDIEDHKSKPESLREDIKSYKGELKKFEDAVRDDVSKQQYFSEIDSKPESLDGQTKKIDILNGKMEEYVKEHKTALDSFKKNIEAHKNDPEALQKDIDEYRPKLETFQEVVQEFKKKKEILQSVGGFVVNQDTPGERGSDTEAIKSFSETVVVQKKKGVVANLKAVTTAFGRLAKKPTRKAKSGPANTPTAGKKGQGKGTGGPPGTSI